MKKLGKKDKIAQNALELFNEFGVNNVSTNHISEHMNISQGLIYYYFNNKNEIIHYIFDQYQQLLNEKFKNITSKKSEVLETFYIYMDSVFFLQWEYRFFYIDLISLISKDSQLEEKYLDLRKKLSKYLNCIINHFIDCNILKLEENEVNYFIDNLKLHCSSWMNYRLTFFNEEKISKRLIYEEIIKILFHFKIAATSCGKKSISNLERKYLEKIIMVSIR